MDNQTSAWVKLNKTSIKERIFNALDKNVNFSEELILGLPGSRLDPLVFFQDAPFLTDAPYLSSLIRNPNHIGCHTLGDSEPFFAGTQEIEKEVLKICAEDILRAEKDSYDGFVASGGTEANIQAAWIYRNYFIREKKAKAEQIAIVCSEDNHYSAAKAANILGLPFYRIPVDADSRKINTNVLEEKVEEITKNGIQYVIVIANMMTTMFGSVDDPDQYSQALKKAGIPFFMHVDGAYGGFVYPFNGISHKLDFSNPDISSVTLDAHKMVQAPYGTGIFLIRKNFMHYVLNEEASYVKGLDTTLIGSRSGANAIAIWMILVTYGKDGWTEKIRELIQRTDRITAALIDKNIKFYRERGSNIITIRAGEVPGSIIDRFNLIPDNHTDANWHKIVVMEHVDDLKVNAFIDDLKKL